jgi:type II secretory pathway component GspD/PulD (secretin)
VAKIFLFFAIIFLLSGCTNSVDKPKIAPIQKPVLPPKTPAVQTVTVQAQNFVINEAPLPEGKIIKRLRIMGATVTDVISMLSEATGESIVFQLESQSVDFTNDDDDNDNQNEEIAESRILTQSKVYLSANNIGLGKALQKAVGNRMSVTYEDGIYYIGDVKSATVKIPSIEALGASIIKSIETFGASKVVYDKVTSSISFSARTREYEEIIEYLKILKDNLYVIEYDMQIYSVNLFDDYNLGINWEVIPSLAKEWGLSFQSASTTATTAVPLTLGIINTSSNYDSASAMMHMLEHFGRVESIQRPKLLGLAGTDVKLKDGTQESYIKSFETTIVGDSGAQTSTVSATAMSGIEITLNSNILDETVVTSIRMQIDDIVGYTGFSVNNQEYRQPKISTKQINNTVRVQPGVPIVISGLYRQKEDDSHRGVPGTSGTFLNNIAGSDYKSSNKSEMVIIVTPRIIKYVMQ